MITPTPHSIQVRFAAPFNAEAYGMFLRTKEIPEGSLAFDRSSRAYTFECPRRFAKVLGVELPTVDHGWRAFAPHLRDYQKFAVTRALDAHRYALWLDTGLGKTPCFLEFGEQVLHRTGKSGRVLLVSPKAIIPQTREMHQQWYQADPITILRDRDEVERFCREGHGFAATNQEKFIGEDPIDACKFLDAFILDEASILKTKGGVIKWNLMKSTRGVPYKLTCTATPAPNDVFEYLSQAGALDKFSDGTGEGSFLASFFRRDKEQNWVLKPHAREGFYRNMVAWSLYMRDPSRFGFEDVLAELPEPVTKIHEIAATEAQRELAREIHVERSGDMLGSMRMGVGTRTKLSQIAKGFVYEGKKARAIESEKPRIIAKLAHDELGAGKQVLIWCVFDEEINILVEKLGSCGVEVVRGATPEEEREQILERFRTGQTRILITRADMMGKGMNFQFCSCMIISGYTDSFEAIYQLVRRCVRPGQKSTVTIHVPMIPELEGSVWENVQEKWAQFDNDCALFEQLYLEALRGTA